VRANNKQFGVEWSWACTRPSKDAVLIIIIIAQRDSAGAARVHFPPARESETEILVIAQWWRAKHFFLSLSRAIFFAHTAGRRKKWKSKTISSSAAKGTRPLK
jgi:hypothetical protein